MKVIEKETYAVGISFKILDKKSLILVDHKNFISYLVFDVNVYFTSKSHWIIDRHKNTLPEYSKYSRVLFRESAIIALTTHALNTVDVFVANIRNA